MPTPTPTLEAAPRWAVACLAAAVLPGAALLLTPGTEHLQLWVFGIVHPLVGHVAAGLLVHSLLRTRPEGAGPDPRVERAVLGTTIVTCIAFVTLAFLGDLDLMD